MALVEPSTASNLMGAAGSSTYRTASFVLGVDLDGVCADFAAGLRPIAAEWLDVPVEELSPCPTYNYPEWNLEAAGGFDALYRYAVTRRDLFRDLPPVPGASLALRRLWTRERVRIRIITHRLYFEFFHRVAVAQTIEWLDRHDFPYWDLCFMRDKAAVGADLYIEDSASNVEALRAGGKNVIVFITPANRHLDPPQAHDWEEVEKMILEEIERWHRTIQGSGPQPIPGS
ncbi:MAG: 5' nucleotidase, NT5C type [Acidimicrobiia bacterium]